MMHVDPLFGICLAAGLVLLVLSLLVMGVAGHVSHVLGHLHLHLHFHLPDALEHVLHLGDHAVHGLAQAAGHVTGAHEAAVHGVGAHGAGVHTPGATALGPTWLLPFILGACLCAFGGTGMVARAGAAAYVLAVLLALVVTALVALALIFGMGRPMVLAESAGYTVGASLLGTIGHVAVDIPAGSVGSVAYVSQGQRATMPARGKDGEALSKGTPVMIVDIESHVASVEAC